MNEEALETIAEFAATMSGQLQAMQLIQDVLVSTLLTSFPALAETMEQHLQLRYDFAPGELSGTALQQFQHRLDSFRHGIATLRG